MLQFISARFIDFISSIDFGYDFNLDVNLRKYFFPFIFDMIPFKWKWDTGYTVPTYNTQQNWVVRHDGLYLVYTRKDGKNDHVFRNRAPLYMCKVDADRLCLLRATERAITPERGARMGNFGVTHISDHASIVVTTEWMQPLGCEKYGSNNAIYAVYITD